MNFYWLNYSWTGGFELVTRGFELGIRGFELVTPKVELITREFELVDLNSQFRISACAFKFSTLTSNS